MLGGGERHLADLANTLAVRGHDVFAALRPNSPLISELTRLPELNLVTLPLRNSLDARSARQLVSFVKNQKIEIVHAHMARDYPLAVYATMRNPNARLIITRHVLFPLTRLHKLTLARVARVIAVSEAVGRQFRAEKLVPPERVTVVHNGIDIAQFETARAQFDRGQFCRRWHLPEETVLVGSVGALTPLKGHEDFLRAVVQVGSLFPKAHFILAGEDASAGQENRRKTESLIQKLNLSDRTSLIGRMDDITDLYCALDVFVSASHTESFGLAIAEAMAGGAAVVATKTDGAREIIEDGQTGLLVPVGDSFALAQSVSELLKDNKLRERLSGAAHESVSLRFSLDRMVDETEGIYSDVLQES